MSIMRRLAFIVLALVCTASLSSAAPVPWRAKSPKKVFGQTSSAIASVPPVDRVASGTMGVQNANVAVSTAGIGTIGLTLTGTWVATVTFQATIDGTNWVSVGAVPIASGVYGVPVTSTTANGQYLLSAPGFAQVRAIATAYTSGTVTATFEANQSPQMFNSLVQGVDTAGSSVTANPISIGGQDLAGNAQPLRITANKAAFVGIQNSDKATYVCNFTALAVTASMDLCAIESGTTKIVRIRRIAISNPGNQTTGGLRQIQLMRTTVAGTGSTQTPPPVDSTDAAYSGIVRSGNTGGNLGTAGTVMYTIPVFVPAALAGTIPPVIIDFAGDGSGGFKAPTGIAGVANGISLRDPGAAGGANMSGYVEFTEE